VQGLVISVLTVIGLIGMVIGWRAALVVAVAIPVCYGLPLAVNRMVGYSINRVTLFALILPLGLLVDDPITDIENIARYFATKRLSPPVDRAQSGAEGSTRLAWSRISDRLDF
jgi:multidrug efflux pump subunit AcrB